MVRRVGEIARNPGWPDHLNGGAIPGVRAKRLGNVSLTTGTSSNARSLFLWLALHSSRFPFLLTSVCPPIPGSTPGKGKAIL